MRGNVRNHDRVRLRHPPAPWRWPHTLALLLLVPLALAVFLLPLDVAAHGGMSVFDEANARYLRAGLAGFAAWVALVVRGQPWWHTLVCLLIAAFAAGQWARGVYSPEVGGIPLNVLLLYVGLTVYLLVLAIRPSVYERLEAAEAELRRLRGESDDHR